MKHLNRFGKGKEQRPRIRIRILRGYGSMNAGAVISPPAGAAQILLAKKDQLGRPFAEVVSDDEPVVAAPVVATTPVVEDEAESAHSAAKKKTGNGNRSHK